MKVFVYFVEPASYTIDLINNVHKKYLIDYTFIKNKSLAKASDSQNIYNFLTDLSLFKKLKFIYQTLTKYDFIIINGYSNYVFIITFLLNKFLCINKFIGIESDTQLNIPSKLFKKISKYIILKNIFHNKYILGLSGGNYTHKELFSYYGMNKNRIFLLPMMVDNSKYYNSLINKNNEFTFLFVGRLIQTKNVDVLCDVFINNFSNKKAKLIIVGANNDCLKEEYNNSKIVFMGKVFGDDLIKLYHNSSAFVFPSTKEAWGLVVNEALSSSLPVIAHCEVGAIHDLIINKETGFVIQNLNDLGDKMLELYNNKKLYNKFSINAYKTMKNYWNYDLYRKSLNKVLNFINK